MKILLIVKDGPRRKCVLPYTGCKHVDVEGSCPACLRSDFIVAGGDPHPSADDRAWECDACCLACKVLVGTLRVEPSTIFGVTEDERVLNGRVRVY